MIRSNHIKKTALQWFCLFLTAALLLSTGAAEVSALADDTSCYDSGYIENPLYEAHTEFTDSGVYLSEDEDSSEIKWCTVSEAICQMRDAMEARETIFQLHIASSEKPKMKSIMTAACSEEYADSPTTGDYLNWSWSKMRWDGAETETGSGLWTFTVYSAYYDTAEQEAEFREQLNTLAAELDLWAYSDAMRYQKIYDYVTAHVAYDETGLATHSEDYWGYDESFGINTYIDPNGDDDWLIYTAYDALCCGKAVCQGYSSLLYALCRSYDMPVRIQDGSNHSWNIVELKNSWYYLDATWDHARTQEEWQYFLVGTDGFSGHSPKAAYETEEYLAAYPLSETAYTATELEQNRMPFTDLVRAEYYWEPVRTLYFDGITNGISDTQFDPDGIMNRAMVVTMLYRLAGEPECGTTSFSDVPEKSFYAKAVAWAVEKKITLGTGPDTFSPEEPVNREQLATFLYRYAQACGNDVSGNVTLTEFEDAGQVSSFALEAMKWAAAEKIVLGTSSTTLSPQNSGTRAQIATMIYRFLKNVQS